MEKKCTKCGEVKSLDEFGNHKGNKDGKMYTCKACKKAARKVQHNAHVKAWRARPNHRKLQRKPYRRSPSQKAARNAYTRKYRQRPEVKEKRRLEWANNPRNKARRLEYDRSEHAKALRQKRHELNPKARTKHHADRRARLINAPSDEWKVSDIHSEANGRCLYCGIKVTLEEMHADHFIPLAKGGSNLRENIVCSCASCNLKKNAKMPEDFIGETL